MKLIELLAVVSIIAVLLTLSITAVNKAYWNCKRKMILVQMKHNGDIEKAVNDQFGFLHVADFSGPIIEQNRTY